MHTKTLWRAFFAAFALLLALPATGQEKKTFCNPLDLVVPGERSYRGGEPVVITYQDDYYLFVSHRKGYWYSPDFKDWTYVDAPDYPGGVVSVVEKDGALIGCSMNNKNVYKALDPKKGVWEKVGTFDSDRYGDANLFVDDDGRLYMYYGWSQLMPFKVVELDPTTFKEISEPKVLFFSDYRRHGFEKRTRDDVIYSIFGGRRDYFEEEYPWIEGPWMTKHNGKYYLQYAAIGLELLSYSHGVYVSDSPTGPFTYSQHNPLTFKTTGFAVGAGHGSTFHDKNGQLWTICMIPSSYGGAGRGSELAIFPTAVDAEGVMHSNEEFGDYPQFWPGTRTDAVDNNWTGWKLLSLKKKATASSTAEGFATANAVDENFLTNWAAETGEPGEWFQIDLGKVADIYAIQCNWDHIGAQMPARQGFGGPAPANPEFYQCFSVEVSLDGQKWTKVIDKPDNKLDLHHDYTELAKPAQGRFVKVTNTRQCHDGAKFSIKDLRVFGNPASAGSVKVADVKVVRNPEDRREAELLWEPVPGADGYIIRYGIEPGKLYNSYIVYDANSFKLHSLNTESEYTFEVESFDSGLDFFRQRSEEIDGTGGEVEINKRVPGRPAFSYGGNDQTKRVMIKEGQDRYVFDGIDPGFWTISHSYGPVLWSGELTEADLVGEGEPGIEAKLTEMGTGTQITAEMWMKVERGAGAGRVVLEIRRQPRRGGWQWGGGMGAPQMGGVASPVVHPDNTVTFNYQDAKAKSVKVKTQFAGDQEMTRGENGVWTVTLGPVVPDMYPYSFDVDGVQVMDPQNPDWFPNETFKNSILDVRGSGEPLLHALKDVPHGSVDYVNYWSGSLGVFANAIVYTPPQYDKDKKKKYPVFYLISGTTDTEEVYFKVGRMNLILDNLLAEGKAKEMIIVLPYGNPSKYYPAGRAPRMGDLFTKDLINDLMPFVEKNYRTLNDRDHRAIGGFSRGGNQGLAAGLTNLDKFSWLCSYSSFTSTVLPGGVYDDPDINDKIHLFWLGVGTDDFLYGNAKDYMDFLDSKGIDNVKVFTDDKFGHTWMNAKYWLDESLPLLFQEKLPEFPKTQAPEAGKDQQLDGRVMARLFPAGVVSPEYNADGSVTFRCQAADAKKVELDCQMFPQAVPMTKGERGVWSVTVTPGKPDIYPYAFVIDGTKIADPNNMFIFPNEGFKYSLADVRGPEPSVQDIQDVPHGKVSYRFYHSNTCGIDRPLTVYTPAGYDPAGSERLPVLYLIHGMTDTYETWFKVGNVNNILDNLIAAGKAKRMIVVMPYANPYIEMMRQGLADRYDAMDTDRVAAEIINDVKPFIEANYKVRTSARDRAVAGFSLGGRQALATGLGHPEVFQWVCAMAPAIFGTEYENNFANGTYVPVKTLNKSYRLIWLGTGTSDFLIEPSRGLDAFLTENGVKHTFYTPDGGHTWMNCRDYLTRIAQLLFK